MFKFSEAKNADEYSFGGEDGLDETPFIFENERLIYLGTPKWSDLSIYASKNISSDILLRFGIIFVNKRVLKFFPCSVFSAAS